MFIHTYPSINKYIHLPDFNTLSRQGHSFMMFQYHLIHIQCIVCYIIRNKVKKHSIMGVYTNFEKCYFQNRIYIVYALFKFITTPQVHFESFVFRLAPPTSLNSTRTTFMPVSLHHFFSCLN